MSLGPIYHLVVSTDGGNDMRWFFTFANIHIRVMKGTLYRKHVYVKK
jgi:hypothetical protein